MATDVQQLLLKIDATTELARRELRQMDGEFTRFQRRSEEAAGGVDSAFANLGKAASAAKATIVGFAVGVGIDGLVGFGKAILDAADDIATAADRVGIATERYQELKESLRVLEVDGEKVERIFGILNDTLGAVQGGTAAGGAAAALDKMGISTRILNGEIITADQLLTAIAGSASNFSSEAEFTAAVIDIVGRKVGVELAAALKDGGLALEANAQAFRDSGNVVSEEYIARLAEANEAIDQFVSRSKSALIIWAAETLDYVGRVAEAFQNLSVLQALTQSPLATARQIFDQSGTDPRQLTFDASPGNSAAFGGFGGRSPQPAALPRRTAAATARSSGSRSGAASRPSLTPAQQRLNADFSPTAAGLAALLDPGPIVNLDTLADQLKTEISPQLVVIKNQFDSLAEVSTKFSADLSRNLGQAIVLGQNLGDALINSLQAAAAELISGALFKVLGGALGSVLGGGGLGGLFGGAFANGGSPPVGRVSLVGERGPELFVPRVPGTIIPNGAFGGGGSVYQSFDLRGAVVTEDLYRQMQVIGAQAAQAGAVGGAQLAAQNQARRANRRLG